ncbi:NAD(P)-dependent oxidoreductase [Rhodoplanes sp. TEM]|uniref:NAD(P)-dependent oxidoreductase n=1 Tax=Rhodoplanes tepidamans TaxID=200616 RepID=A0ABT5J5T0_RHOTP|nr:MULTISPECIES: NAD(P)-dependent oxidoreductase [Rhodoplanes]MDC7784654.1 NAD(P)-dependent oxidoreductase [Rhodoplanes tepidamans]MDC7982121.1 NAD(P)-dependent oxidoreductase [Rhodoplanes sp. TEM]MDQ0356123.1 3-hydroxyisobutyrate dehydrogenase-like beta-hydroxyacid dehydrogenase [Rhodoplanes tepidamans]
MKVVFIGTGAIGLPMAKRIAGGGHAVIGVDPSPEARAKAKAAGIETVKSFADTAGADVVVVMVATPAQLATVVDTALAETGGRKWVAASPFASPATRATWIVMSTVGPASVQREGARLQEAGAVVIDAPVTGGTARAATGELKIFTAGKVAEIAAVRPVLDTMGEVRVVGDTLGQGQSVKVVNQHLCSVHLAAAGEALALADSLGLDKTAVLDLVKGGAGGSWMLSDRGPRMLLGTDAPVTSTISIFVKDSTLVADAAAACGAAVPLLDVAKSRFAAASAAGLAVRDDSRVIETYRKPTP